MSEVVGGGGDAATMSKIENEFGAQCGKGLEVVWQAKGIGGRWLQRFEIKV